ncbi:universal stress protein [Mycolicibacterium sp. 018/SC-01/001]|uniref:universal stress protein n=1 Tax=Mycolicibacterium sp. 018/SC-01/001 TaxID=2592069 RepID=UPI00117C2137|nr:universal stress protein [Mycolicibacterium sp. 018/SC-01/001]TRW81696.1 universal stress protein [Mycolicibacterium sp. 018/SC-01/001]
MSAPDRQPVVVGVDGSPSSSAALAWAARDAVLRGVDLTVLHAAAPTVTAWPGGAPAGVPQWQREQGRQVLDDAARTARELIGGAVDVRTGFASTSPTTALVEASRTARVVVVGSRGRGALARTVLGSVSTALVHRAHGPVAVVHDGAAARDQGPVVVGVDSSKASDLALDIAFDEAARRAVPLIAVHAWWSPGAFDFPGFEFDEMRAGVDAEVTDRLSGWRQRNPTVRVEISTVPDQPARRLVERAESAQLLVVGSHGDGAVASTLLGSVSSAVVQAATVPVIVARSG